MFDSAVATGEGTRDRHPELTIGMPAYNSERYIGQAVESMLAQTYHDFVLVVSDNASSDRTPDIVAEYASSDPRIVFLRAEANRGAAWNFNYTFTQCKTPFFKWAAADDVLAPTFVERCLSALRDAPPSVALCYSRTQWIDAEGRKLDALAESLATSPGAPPHRRFRHVVANAVYGNVTYAVMRSEALRRTRMHGNYPSADIVLLAELALEGAFLEIPEPLFFRRDHEQASRRVNPSPEAASLWYDPASRAVRHEQARLFVEHLAAIRHARLTSTERALALAAFLEAWTRRRVRLRTRIRTLAGRV